MPKAEACKCGRCACVMGKGNVGSLGWLGLLWPARTVMYQSCPDLDKAVFCFKRRLYGSQALF